MRNKVQILSVRKNAIIIRKCKRRRNYWLGSICAVSFMICMVIVLGGATSKDLARSMSYIYNPVNSLYSDNSNIIFASVNAISRDNLNFVLPMSGSVATLDSSGNISMVVGSSIMIKATEAGVVEDVGTTVDGIKYIKILHCLDVCSVVENVDVVGVSKGDIVKRGQDIATVREGEKITLRLFDAGQQITNLKLNQSKIIWQD